MSNQKLESDISRLIHEIKIYLLNHLSDWNWPVNVIGRFVWNLCWKPKYDFSICSECNQDNYCSQF